MLEKQKKSEEKITLSQSVKMVRNESKIMSGKNQG